MSEPYVRPPLQEALCEFQFAQDGSWDATTLGLIYGRLQADYPIKQPILTFSINLAAADQQEGLVFGAEQVTRIADETQRSFAQLAPYHLMINRLSPYPGWATFRPQILRGLAAYRAVIAAPRLRGMTVRYINRVSLPTGDHDLAHWFTLYPVISDERLRHYASFITGLQVEYAGGRDLLAVVLTSPQELEQRESSIIFDLSYHLRQPDQVPFEQLPDWIDAAHIAIEEVFETCVTDALRATFREERPS